MQIIWLLLALAKLRSWKFIFGSVVAVVIVVIPQIAPILEAIK